MTVFRRLLWNPLFRIFAFWLIVAAAFVAADYGLDQFSLGTLPEIVETASTGGLDQAATLIENEHVVYSLALAIIVAGGALLIAFLLMHALAVSFSIWRIRRALNQKKGELEFARDYDERIKSRLLRHPLIGTAWKEFDDTLLKESVDLGKPIENTIRPQVFFNVGLIRERLAGLKFISSISGYFVGTGLLLTFIGIVLALHKASAAAGSSDVQEMQAAVTQLLRVASFKFWTSIAGLGTSIAFALLSRWFVIWIESSLSRFCEAVEHQLKYSSPNFIAAESLKVGQEQRDELKEINSDRYFSKLADSVAPLIEQAMARAMSPVTETIGSAVEQLKSTSQTGLAAMTKDFAAALHSGAGTEMRGLQDSLREIQASLARTHESMQGSGEDFARRLTEAAENLSRLVADAGTRLEGSADQSRQALAELMASFGQTIEAANARIDAELGSAAAGASSRLEEAMGRVLERLQEQVGGLANSLWEFQSTATARAEQTSEHLQAAEAGMAKALATASDEVASALKDTISDALSRIAAEIDRFQSAVGKGEAALAGQASAIGDATSQTRSVADAFSDTAERIRASAAPLLESSERIARAAGELNSSVERTAASMESASERSGELAEALTEQIGEFRSLWEGYRAQFDKVDQDLARAIETLSGATAAQADKLNGFVTDVDSGLSKAVGTLASIVDDIRGNTDELSESIAKLADQGRHLAAGSAS